MGILRFASFNNIRAGDLVSLTLDGTVTLTVSHGAMRVTTER